MTKEQYFNKIKRIMQSTKNYDPGHDLVIEQFATLLSFMAEQVEAIEEGQGLVQTFERNGTRQVSPELSVYRGLLGEFFKFVKILGLSPAAWKELGLKKESGGEATIMNLAKAK